MYEMRASVHRDVELQLVLKIDLKDFRICVPVEFYIRRFVGARDQLKVRAGLFFERQSKLNLMV